MSVVVPDRFRGDVFILVITDANNTKTLSKADYDDFTFITVPPPEPETDNPEEEPPTQGENQ